MLSTILSAFTVAEIRKNLAFTAMLLALYRLGSHIPVPGVDPQAVKDIQRNFGNGNILALLNTFSAAGSSLMIFASIVSRLLEGLQACWTNPDQVFRVMMPYIALAVVAGVVFVQEGQRRIPIQYAKRVIGRRMTQGGQTYLPLRVNMAGVIPVIFAASLMAFPPTVGQLIDSPTTKSIATFFSPQQAPYVIGQTIL